MNTAIVVTIIICGTILAITVIAILFAMWVINQGVEFERQKRK
jgi:hypothetical protein